MYIYRDTGVYPGLYKKCLCIFLLLSLSFVIFNTNVIFPPAFFLSVMQRQSLQYCILKFQTKKVTAFPVAASLLYSLCKGFAV